MLPKHSFGQFTYKFTALLLVAGLNVLTVSSIGRTNAYFVDSAKSTGNSFEAGIVDFALEGLPINPYEPANNMQPGKIATTTLSLDPLNSNPFVYYATTTVAGDLDFCKGLIASTTQDGAAFYAAPLASFQSGTTTSTSSLEVSFTTNQEFANKYCDFDFAYLGWQTRHGYDNLGGFWDTEFATGTIKSGGFRINKVYYDVAPSRGSEGENEWVEIYNQAGIPVDISGWKICDNTSCDTIPANTPLIPANGYALITNDGGTASATSTAFWHIASSVIYIPLEQDIGNGLHNDNDMLVLVRPDGYVVDQMNWGIPDITWTNYATYFSGLWNPGAVDVAEGNLLARVPSGYDSDQPSDWKEIKPPLLDLIFPDEHSVYNWSWGDVKNLRWSAINQNGASTTNLAIDIYWIKDDDHTGTITAADTSHLIVASTTNDGRHKWTVPDGWLGYIWIVVVATGPENVMNNTIGVSGKIWDPMPVLILPPGETSDSVDIEPPTLTMNGNNPSLIEVGQTYSDLGVMVSDNVNMNLGYEVEGDEIDTSAPGIHEVHYSAKDMAGNSATAVRVVIVYDPALGLPDLSAYAPSENEEIPAPFEVTPEEPAPSGGAVDEVLADTELKEEEAATPDSVLDVTDAEGESGADSDDGTQLEEEEVSDEEVLVQDDTGEEDTQVEESSDSGLQEPAETQEELNENPSETVNEASTDETASVEGDEVATSHELPATLPELEEELPQEENSEEVVELIIKSEDEEAVFVPEPVDLPTAE